MSDEELFTKAAGLFPKDKIIVMSEEEMGTLEMLKKRWQEKALTAYKKELLSKPMSETELPKVQFNNVAPEDTEWTAHIEMLNNYTEPDRYLRHIIQYARSGPFYPTNMHVDLIRQIMANRKEGE